MANDFMGALRAAAYEYKLAGTAGDDGLEAARDTVAGDISPVDAATAKTAMDTKLAAIVAAEAALNDVIVGTPEVPESSEGAGDGVAAVVGLNDAKQAVIDAKQAVVSAKAVLVKSTPDGEAALPGEYADEAAKAAAITAAETAVTDAEAVVTAAEAEAATAKAAVDTAKDGLDELVATYRAAASNDAAVAAIGAIGEPEA